MVYCVLLVYPGTISVRTISYNTSVFLSFLFTTWLQANLDKSYGPTAAADVKAWDIQRCLIAAI